MKSITLSIQGMSCGHCVGTVRSALQKLDGVEVERITVGSATVRYDSARTAPAAIVGAVVDAGYAARVTE